MRATRTVVTVILFGTISAACEKCRPDLVGAGVARLTVRNTGAIADLINRDQICGFESPEVKANFQTEGSVGGQGTAVWTVEECEIDLNGAPAISTDCNGDSETINGRVVVSAKRHVSGTVTGNPDQPIIPLSPDAVVLEITRAELHRFSVESSGSDAKLTQLSGALSASVRPRLAASASTGVCMIPTRNVLISDIRYENARVHVKTEDRDFEVDVPASDFWAVNGKYDGEENALTGVINVWGDAVQVPGDGDGLDPDYDAEVFDASYACTEDLKDPISYECGDVAPVLAQGAARLTIRSLGTIADLVDKDTSCGFASSGVLTGAQTSGAVGSEGEVTFRVQQCSIAVASGSAVGTKNDCQGVPTLSSGRVTVTATKRLRGRLTGDLAQPVVPVNDTPAELEFERIAFENFSVESDGTALTMASGAISARLTPRTAMDSALGACGFETPIARFTNVAYENGSRLTIRASQGTFETMIEASNLSAVNGAFGSEVNTLDGTISIGGETFMLPTNPGDDGLVPEYDQAAFDASWMCGTVDRAAPFECNFVRPLAQGAAQLSVLTLGTIADLIEADASCGFSSPAVLAGVQINGALGAPGGTATFTLAQPCALSFGARTAVQTDCSGKTIYVQGTASVRGTKVLSGYVSGDPLQPIVPTTRSPARIDLAITFSDFRISNSVDGNALTAKTGMMAGTVEPRTGIDVTTGACSIPTPVAELSGITWQNGQLKVESQGKTFDINVPASALAAVNGTIDGASNRLNGSITVEGESVLLDGPLDPSYSESGFEASYTCTPNLQIARSDQDCNMKKPLAEGTARLLISALGAVTGLVNEDDECGFSANLTDPSLVVGEDGQMGALEWEIQRCELSNNGRNAYDTDCLDRAAFYSGSVEITGKRRVEGLREDIDLLFVVFHSITPTTRESVTVTENMISFNNFVSYELDPGQTTADRAITIRSGTMSAVVNPITGENASERGSFDIGTTVARMENVTVSNADVQIRYQGKTFDVRVDSATLSAFNGSYQSTGEKNSIAGSITVGGETFVLEPQALDPEFDQADFDRRYACTEDLLATVPPAP